MPRFPLGSHEAKIYRNIPMNRYDISCVCGWKAYADSADECSEAFIEHEKAEKAPEE